MGEPEVKSILKTRQVASAEVRLPIKILKCNSGFTLTRAHGEVGVLLRSLPEE